jgi:hypothetical protein
MASGAKAVVPISAAVKIVASFLVIFVPSFHRSQLAGGDISPAPRPVRLANGTVVEIVPIFSITALGDTVNRSNQR